jgi:CRISPR-associated protein Cmr3
MLVKIMPLDTVFFRDGKPFSFGEETWADVIFPPFPSTFYGAIRTMWFSENIQEFSEANIPEDKTQKLELKFVNIFMDYLYFPQPLDLVKEKELDEQKTQEVFALNLFEFKDLFFTNLSLSSYPSSYIDDIENYEGFIDIFSLIDYLKNEEETFFVNSKKTFLKYEPKIGIGRNFFSRTIEEGKLYRVNMVRFKKGVCFIAELEDNGLNLPDKHLLKLGAEGKAALFKKETEIDEELEALKNLPKEILSIIEETKKFKLYLATPAIFKNGWLPSWIDKESLTGEYNGIKLKLISACVGKPICIGGFGMKERSNSGKFRPQPKKMLRAVSAGSVYWFEIENPSENKIKKILKSFHYQNISEERQKEGFGFSLVGGVR